MEINACPVALSHMQRSEIGPMVCSDYIFQLDFIIGVVLGLVNRIPLAKYDL